MNVWIIGDNNASAAVERALAGDSVTVVEASLVELGDLDGLPEPDLVLISSASRHLEPFLPAHFIVEWLD